MGEFEIYAISSKATLNNEYSYINAENVEALYDLTSMAKQLYDTCMDNEELDAMYKKLDERYRTLLDETGIKEINSTVCNDTVYDLGGRKHEKKPKKGIYIVNGKKRLIK